MTHASKIKHRIDCLRSGCSRLSAFYPRYPREAKVTLTIARAPREGNDSDEGARREEQGAGRGWPPTATYKSQERPPPEVKRSSTPAETDSTYLWASDPIRSDFIYTSLLFREPLFRAEPANSSRRFFRRPPTIRDHHIGNVPPRDTGGTPPCALLLGSRRLTRVQLQLAADLCTVHGERGERARSDSR